MLDVILCLELDVQNDDAPPRKLNVFKVTFGGWYGKIDLKSLQIEAERKALGNHQMPIDDQDPRLVRARGV